MNRDEPQQNRRDRGSASNDRRREVIWLSAVTALAVYFAVGTVSTYRTDHLRGRARVWEIWDHARDVLPGENARGVVTALYLLALACLLGGAAVALWLALADADDSASRPATDRSEPIGHR